ncbi:lactonase family protein [Cycloclasticus pugetii]|uniref:lactonase family protein n=1 Tax=Cycloclasticus pugetii TaxID=34068 RepID=UPI003A95C86E
MFAYVGCRTTKRRNARGTGIQVFKVSDDFKNWTKASAFEPLENPSYLLINKRQDRLYCIHGDRSEISAFSIDPFYGSLHFINQVSTGGANPVHLAFNADETHIVISNHISSSVAAVEIDTSTGGLLPRTDLFEILDKPGPHKTEQPFPKPHANPLHRNGWFYIPDKGTDKILGLQLKDGVFCRHSQHSTELREGSGPRHLAYHPHLSVIYCVNELDSTVTTLKVSENGTLSPVSTQSTVRDSFTEFNRAAGITINCTGSRLFVSNRGEDSVSVFNINAQGLLSFAYSIASGGQTPRFIDVDTFMGHLHIANEDSDNITTFKVSEDHAEPIHTLPTASPVCIVFKY